jgi:hypothetical protein
METPKEESYKSPYTFKSERERTVEFFKRNRKKIENYVITPILGAISLPVMGAYISTKKKIGNKFLGALAGAIATIILFTGITNIQTRYVNNYEIKNIQITHNYDFPAQKENKKSTFSKNLIAISLGFGTNYGILAAAMSPLKEVTTIEVFGQDGEERIEGIYKLPGFQTPSDLKKIKLPKLESLALNKHLLRGEKGRQFYDGLCREVFESTQKDF